MAQQTAVEWLFQEFFKVKWDSMQGNRPIIFEQAKAMEIESLEDCWIAAEQSEDSQTFFNYYNETYNK
jgi:hypothetical protein